MQQTVIKDRAQSGTGLLVVQDGNKIQTINRAEQLIHSIELDYVPYQILVHRWIGYRTNEQFKEIIDGHFMDLFRKNRCTKVVVDISEMTGTFNGINDWMAEYLMPKLVTLGFRASAVILPKNIFVKLSADEWEEKTSGFTNRNFEKFPDALIWLKKQ